MALFGLFPARMLLNGGTDPSAETPDEADGSDAETSADPAVAGLQAALAAEREKRRAAEAALKERLDAQAEADRLAAEKRGEYEQLYSTEKERAEQLAQEVEQFRAREQARTERLQARNAERIDALPEALKALAEPLVESLSPDDLAAWLDRARSAAADDLPRGTRSRGSAPAADQPDIPDKAKAEVERLAAKWRVEPAVAWTRLGSRLQAIAAEGKRLSL